MTPKRKPNLRRYSEKRDFAVTSEPPPRVPERRPGQPSTFMVHKHDARRLHYDLRLEMDGALASWAIPKGPSTDPKTRRLAVETEDHPLDYGTFEGRIPEGEYGAGDSIIWDRGVYETIPPGSGSGMRKKGHIDFVLLGEKLKGRWHLVRTRREGDKAQWILFKARDEYANETFDVVAEHPESVVSGRRVTRGPVPERVRQAPGAPLPLLMRIWPPMQAARAPRLPAGKQSHYLFEGHPDGPRALAGLSHGRATLQSEEGRDLGAACPRVVEALTALPAIEAAIDGTLTADKKRLFLHDLLWLDGEDLRERPVEQRRELLAGIVPSRHPFLSLAPELAGPAAAAIEAARSLKLPAVMAKKWGSPYRPGPSRDWIAFSVPTLSPISRRR